MSVPRRLQKSMNSRQSSSSSCETQSAMRILRFHFGWVDGYGEPRTMGAMPSVGVRRMMGLAAILLIETLFTEVNGKIFSQ